MGKGIYKRRHKKKMHKQRLRQIKRGRAKTNKRANRRSVMFKGLIWSPNPKGK